MVLSCKTPRLVKFEIKQTLETYTYTPLLGTHPSYFRGAFARFWLIHGSYGSCFLIAFLGMIPLRFTEQITTVWSLPFQCCVRAMLENPLNVYNQRKQGVVTCTFYPSFFNEQNKIPDLGTLW